ncbi:hypothetical protein M407DRAFT_28923 [Tulasnella calospora MUT 4182]|uniref:F-box domain-containing protein n=1 Tax=Tulasnella calospora MUT 4182 TaxID=1051891 RepID=A0A0C3QB31_9AGAM|nr:hypothetical protein M407DRAFT_28923 [Tulasnella calospora MUT 4182]
MQKTSAPSNANGANKVLDAERGSININSLFPPELLVGVFDILYQDIMDSLPFPLPYDEGLQRFKNHPLGDFMLVCRVWYDIIQTTPTYWTFVDIGALHNTALGEQAHAVRSFGSEGVRDFKIRLKKSGSLPIYVTVAPEYISDFSTVLDILKEHAHQLETINIVKMRHLKSVTLRHISSEQLLQLFRLSLPSLKRLHIDAFRLVPPRPEPWVGGRVEIDAPQLYHLSSHFHILIPHNPSQLTSLSMSGIDMLTLQSTLTQGQVQLPKLLHLRIVDCEPGLLLSTLSIPLLQVLVYHSEEPSTQPPEELPEYSHVKDLQWSDVGLDPTFDLVFRCCPNLTRYANYVIGEEMAIDINLIVDGPTILRPGRINSITWPNLEEVLFDCATYAVIRELVDAAPTIKRIRTLRDPVVAPLRHDEDVERERTFLSELKEKADVVLWLDLWTAI